MSYRIGLTVVGTFQSSAEAEVAKGVLAAVGIEALIRSGSELLVRTEDAAKAKDALTTTGPVSMAKSAEGPGDNAIRELRDAMVKRRHLQGASQRR
jgi:hypothetical protein